MRRDEMIEELMERVEEELAEFTNAQLEAICTEYKHSPLLNNLADDIEMDEDEEAAADDKNDDMTIIDGEEWGFDED